MQNKVPFEYIETWSQTIAVAMGAEHSVLCRHEGRGMVKHKSGTDWPRHPLAVSTTGSPKYAVVNHIYTSRDTKVYI